MIWFFRVILLLIIAIAIFIGVFNINDTVSIKGGEIIASNPQSDYVAPFEAQLVKVNVSEGQKVQLGDTLLILHNKDYLAQQAKIKTEIEYLEKRIQSYVILRDALQKKKVAIAQNKLLMVKEHQLQVKQLGSEIKSLNEQFGYQKARLSSAGERLRADSILYKKDMVSKAEYNQSRDASLILNENIAKAKSLRQQQMAEKDRAVNEYKKEQNNLSLRQIELMENDQSLLQAINDYEGQLAEAKQALEHIENMLLQQYVIANNTGIVNYVFNTTHTSSLIAKGNLLISVAPEYTSYYAKVIIPEKDIQYVRSGLEAKLKLDAYHYLDHGIVNGKVTYLSERKENEKFYALIDLPALNNFKIKSGYSIQGDIVVERMPLYKYIIKRIFKNL
jgi:multidrug resistance efflux pump